MLLKGIENEQLIERSDGWVLLKRINENKQSTKIYKMVNSIQQDSVSNLYYELEMIKLLQSKYTLQPIQIEQHDMNHLLVFQDDESVSFNKYLTKPLPILTFLKIALEMANIFIDIHRSSIVYRNVHRRNFLINENTFEIKVVNFEHAYKFHRETRYKTEQQLMYRSSYFAPEETGRLNVSIDYRTDLYSLGVLFYEMITGFLPFTTRDSQQLFYEIITNEPIPVTEVNQKIPQPIANIIAKLLRKNKADRYQSAIGLKEDLFYCWNMLVNNEPLTEFELGTHDESMFTGLSATIPSREHVVQLIMNRFNHANEQQHKTVFIEGDSGSGKTEILNRLKNESAKQNTVILEVRIDPTMQNVQLAPMISAIRKQLNHIYMEGSERVEYIKGLFEQENVIFYDEIIQLMPELEWFMSEQALQSKITLQHYPSEVNTFFYRTIQYLISVLIKSNDSFIIMIDNAHLIDSSSLQCLKTIYKELTSLHFVITYKEENEGIRELQYFMTDYEHIVLNPLTMEEVDDWLVHSLKEQSTNIRTLASLFYDLTKGNPLFIQELFQTFLQMNLLYYSVQDKCWKIDLQKMTNMKFSDNFIGFFASRIEHLTGIQKEILKVASCIGMTFDFFVVEKFLKLPREQLIEGLYSLVQEGCIVPLNERFLLASTFNHVQILHDMELAFRFVHAEIHQVVYSQISAGEQIGIHYRLANILEEASSEQAADEVLLKIIYHYNLCRELLTGEEKIKVAKWNLRIGANMIYSGLFQNATHFLFIAAELTEEMNWKEDREHVLELWRILGISKYMSGFYDEAEAYFNKGLAFAETIDEKLVLYNEKILFYSSLSSDLKVDINTRKALATTIEALRLVNIELKEDISIAAILKEYSLLNLALRKRPIEQLLHLKKNEDETIHLVLEILLNVAGSALVIDEKLFSWITIRSVRLILKHGDVDFASLIYSNYASILMGGFNDTKRSYQFGLLAIQHVERENIILYKMNVYMNYGINVGFWHKPYVESIYYLKLALKFCLNSKLHNLFAALSVSYIHQLTFTKNKPLHELLQQIEEYNPYLYRTKNVSPIDVVHELKEWAQALTSHTKQLNWDFPVPNKKNVSNWENHIALRLHMSYLFNEERVVMELLDEEAEIKLKIKTIAKSQRMIYSAMWMVRLLQKNAVPKIVQKTYKKHIRMTLKQFKQYVQYAPSNFEHLYYLLKAEYSRYLGKISSAKLYYDRAIQLASFNGFLCDKALGNRCAALFYEEQNERQRAEEYMQQAVELLKEWGAYRLATHWEQQYEYLLQNKRVTPKREVLVPFDMHAVIEVNQILSRETKMDELIQKVLILMMKHADANRSYFFKMENGTMQFIAKAALHNQTFTIDYESGATKKSLSLQSMLQYVLKSEQHVIIDNTDLPSPFMLDRSEKSILCLPIFYQGNMTAILYLANTMTPYVFTNDKIELLKIISAQVAISMEYTKIYEHLEEQVTERTEELHEMNIHLNDMNERLQQNETERKLLLQNVSHDLRSPITSVLGYIDAILDGVVTDPKQQRVHLMRSRERLFSLNHLIHDLFDVSQLE
ncbi:MAG: protein kinase, partial [Lysinibacillus sp.]